MVSSQKTKIAWKEHGDSTGRILTFPEPITGIVSLGDKLFVTTGDGLYEFGEEHIKSGFRGALKIAVLSFLFRLQRWVKRVL